jgi:hypothetical protein
MRYVCLIFIIFVGYTNTFSQVASSQLIDPVTSRVFDIGRYAEINGTPFYKDEWLKGSIVVTAGRYNDLKLKIDLYKNQLLFLKDDVQYEFVEDLKGVVLMPKPEDSTSYLYFEKGISGPALKPDQFVQVLALGKASLYRSDLKLLAEMNEINKGVVKYFNNSPRYFISTGGQVKIVKPGKKDVIEAIGDKAEALEQYCEQNHLSLKKEKEMVELLKFYNSL